MFVEPGNCTHGALTYAVQVQELEFVVIRITPVPPPAAIMGGVAFALAVQFEPVCVIGIILPANVNVALRAEKLFCATYMVIFAGPVPVGFRVTWSQGLLEIARQLQDDGSVRLKSRSPPLESNDTESGLITGS